MKIAVVIPSNNTANLAACVAAIHRCEASTKDLKIICVNDRMDFPGNDVRGIHFISGVSPFVFARNVNIGLRLAFAGESRAVGRLDGATGSDVAIVLNDDATLQTIGGFSTLALKARNVGGLVVAPFPGQESLLKRMVPFWCVAIPANTWNKVRVLDERFIHYGWEDNDYSRRVLGAGLPLSVCNEIRVDHESLPHSFDRNCYPNAKIYAEKWRGQLLPEEETFMRRMGFDPDAAAESKGEVRLDGAAA